MKESQRISVFERRIQIKFKKGIMEVIGRDNICKPKCDHNLKIYRVDITHKDYNGNDVKTMRMAA
jgi:hypothetical protein